jgi:hypothetical protein
MPIKILKSEHQNSFQECAHLAMDFGQQSDESLDLILTPELRFGSQQISERGTTFRLAVRAATLWVEADNAAIVRESRYADHGTEDTGEPVEVTERSTETESRTSRRGMSIDGEAKATGLRAKLSGSRERESHIAAENERHQKFIESPKRVQCVAPGNKWQMRGMGAALEGKYLGDDTLCAVRISEAEGSLSTRVEVAKQDLDVKILEQGLISARRAKLIKIVIAKSLGADPNTGLIRFCGSRSEWELV